jgi:peptidoglycan lytic transglycosylase
MQIFTSFSLRRGLVLAGLVLGSFVAPASAEMSPAKALAAAQILAKAEDWARARATAHGIGRDVIEWQYLRAGEGAFAEYRAFLAKNSDWPGLPRLQKAGEASISDGAAPAQVIAYFARRGPKTAPGLRVLIAAQRAVGASGKARDLAVQAWKTMILPVEDEDWLQKTYVSSLRPVQAERLDMLLWRGALKDAKRQLARVDAAHLALGRARIALAENKDGVNALINAVPARLRNDPGLVFGRFQWRMKREYYESAAELILAQKSFGRAEVWGNRRRALARQLMRDGNGALAYKVAAAHGLKSGNNYTDLEWLAGFIALSDLKDPETALRHFNRFRMAVASPVSLGRAGYWEGRALEAMGAQADARAAYAFGGRFQTSFYGQLAAEKAGLPVDPDLAGARRYPGWQQAGFESSSVFRAAVMLQAAGDSLTGAWFLRYVADKKDADALAQITQLAVEMNDPYVALRMGKLAAGRGMGLIGAYFPMHALARADLAVAPELALSIARRESEFYDAAQSPAGARGLMQLMPGTGKEMAQKRGDTPSTARLTEDPVWNAQLGSDYLAQLIEEFGNYPVLVSAAYNAGPTRARQWIARYGDPRSSSVDVVDWIEHIPYRETRNYVMRVAESLPVYRIRLQGQLLPLKPLGTPALLR